MDSGQWAPQPWLRSFEYDWSLSALVNAILEHGFAMLHICYSGFSTYCCCYHLISVSISHLDDQFSRIPFGPSWRYSLPETMLYWSFQVFSVLLLYCEYLLVFAVVSLAGSADWHLSSNWIRSAYCLLICVGLSSVAWSRLWLLGRCCSWWYRLQLVDFVRNSCYLDHLRSSLFSGSWRWSLYSSIVVPNLENHVGLVFLYWSSALRVVAQRWLFTYENLKCLTFFSSLRQGCLICFCF